MHGTTSSTAAGKLGDNNCKTGCRRRTNRHNDNHDTTMPNDPASSLSSSRSSLPAYSRIVIVGGGMAGLHTALCLAERTSRNHHADVQAHSRWRLWKWFSNRHDIRNEERKDESESNMSILVMEKDEIGNGASGRAKGERDLLLYYDASNIVSSLQLYLNVTMAFNTQD